MEKVKGSEYFLNALYFVLPSSSFPLSFPQPFVLSPSPTSSYISLFESLFFSLPLSHSSSLSLLFSLLSSVSSLLPHLELWCLGVMLYLEPLTPCLFESGCLLTQVCTETQCQRSHGGSRQAEWTTKGNICCLGKGFKGGFSHHNVMLREVSFFRWWWVPLCVTWLILLPAWETVSTDRGSTSWTVEKPERDQNQTHLSPPVWQGHGQQGRACSP